MVNGNKRRIRRLSRRFQGQSWAEDEQFFRFRQRVQRLKGIYIAVIGLAIFGTLAVWETLTRVFGDTFAAFFAVIAIFTIPPVVIVFVTARFLNSRKQKRRKHDSIWLENPHILLLH
jgi:hypothetical protein